MATPCREPTEKQAKHLLNFRVDVMTQKPHSYVADITQLPKALRLLTGLERWVIWRWELREKKNGDEAWTKPPYQCGNPRVAAKSNDLNTWGTYERRSRLWRRALRTASDLC
jgi:hypothetical protein